MNDIVNSQMAAGVLASIEAILPQAASPRNLAARVIAALVDAAMQRGGWINGQV
jgi:hypothetical protein